jgi:hypothetical protein
MTDAIPFDLKTPEGWAQFSNIAGMKTHGLAYSMAGFEGYSVAEAVNRAISTVAEDMSHDGIPADVVAAYLAQYRDHRPELMRGVALAVGSLADVTGDD